MTLATLAKQYDLLTPAERYQAIVAAVIRGDLAEVERIKRAAKSVQYSALDTFTIALGFQRALTHLRLLRLDFALNLAVACIIGFEELAKLSAYCLLTYTEGGRLFAVASGLEPEWCLTLDDEMRERTLLDTAVAKAKQLIPDLEAERKRLNGIGPNVVCELLQQIRDDMLAEGEYE